ncbi:cell wall / vacuolar inhibitor of fructosidase 1-like [Euphorbia lathyris]|uniref:cell wall / vacuolar inhibitor of fructosidase 1-like n=1 Tax=Euphorbia lathyris TaxID=212925 RepID=UPI003313567E
MKLFLIILTTLIFPIHASIIGSELIDQTCKRTPYYELCVWSLLSNPQSFNTDINGLAKIMVYSIEAKASRGIHRINNILEHGQSIKAKDRQRLKDCGNRYRAIIKGDVPESIEAIRTGNYKFAEEGSFDAANEAMSCEEEFIGGSSPLSDTNVAVHDLSIVAASIVKIIINS